MKFSRHSKPSALNPNNLEFSISVMVFTPQQMARADLRANFLYALCELNGENCKITTYEQSTLSGTFRGWKTDGAEILVQGLQTPTGENVNTALMRTSDIISLEFNNDIVLPRQEHKIVQIGST